MQFAFAALNPPNVANSYHEDLFIATVATRQIQQIQLDEIRSVGAESVAWHPLNNTIAFSAWVDDHLEIFTIESDGANLLQLTYGEENKLNQNWIPCRPET